MQMQISEDYIIAPFLVALGSLIGRKSGLELRNGSNWIDICKPIGNGDWTTLYNEDSRNECRFSFF
ncbi:hypothetical protein PNK_2380 [Candidatus Protochlamydia naegleriophila]|uniref:Uncharacterized protein n=1 Tax=Candidatus Protochlamydia naegleriophila TaxID=389348 RepID=A0A0U5JDL7_9BACT|nr:hypothetical protein [Candidatus Protochlamydia naegleriophila]CUI17976.1 hypothetical protein PNK_2380 [Candidatus Protochlamydia naegleriophila]